MFRSASSLPHDTPAARAAGALGHALLLALPLAMWAAGRSAPLVLGLAALACLASGLMRVGPGAVLMRARALVSTPIGLALLTFLLWALASCFWSHRPAAGLRMWGEFAVPLLSGLAIAASGAFDPSRRFARLMAVALLLAAALLAYEFLTGFTERAWLAINDRQQVFYFNRPVLTCLVLAVPVVDLLWRGGKAAERGLALLLGLGVSALVFISDSEAAKLGLVVMVLAALTHLALPRPTLAAIGVAFLATMAFAPTIGLLLEARLPGSVRQHLQPSHEVRIDIWESFGEAALLRPLAGSGFNASATLQDNPVAARVSPPRRKLLAIGHPHSAPLQAWVDTGAVGAGLLALAGLLLVAGLWRLPPVRARLPAAFFAGCFAIVVVAHGAWQGWWIAALALVAILFCAPSAGSDQSGDR